MWGINRIVCHTTDEGALINGIIWKIHVFVSSYLWYSCNLLHSCLLSRHLDPSWPVSESGHHSSCFAGQWNICRGWRSCAQVTVTWLISPSFHFSEVQADVCAGSSLILHRLFALDLTQELFVRQQNPKHPNGFAVWINLRGFAVFWQTWCWRSQHRTELKCVWHSPPQSLTLSFSLGHRMVYADCQEMNTSFPQNVSSHKAERRGESCSSAVHPVVVNNTFLTSPFCLFLCLQSPTTSPVTW